MMEGRSLRKRWILHLHFRWENLRKKTERRKLPPIQMEHQMKIQDDSAVGIGGSLMNEWVVNLKWVKHMGVV